MLNNKKNEFGLIVLSGILFICILIAVAGFTNNISSINVSAVENLTMGTEQIIKLAKVFNENNLDFDTSLRGEYLEWNRNFYGLEFNEVFGNENVIFTVGTKRDKLKGLNIEGKNYAFDLIYCDSYHRYCIFKVNGVPTKRLFSYKEFGDLKQNSFDFDENNFMRIDSVDFDFCDNRRFCHLGFEGYHVVNVSIRGKG